ncbi:hypothetical protein ID866_5477 [Astraeus odoratus]|nr:hypothetical protein ID866_5477 [Astraeus odoratus]
MFHFSTDRLAGLDNMILKITAPSKLPSVIPNHSFQHRPSANGRKLVKRKPPGSTRVPLGDKTNVDSIPTDALLQEEKPSTVLLDVPSCIPNEPMAVPPCEVKLSFVDGDSFRPLPPLPSASPLHVPSFLDLATSSSTLSTSSIQASTSSAPTALLFRVPPTPTSSRKRWSRKPTKEVHAGPHWIPAFHHPNSPYVPWTPSVRQRILPPPSPVSLSPDDRPPCSRSGAIAPEPWASDTLSDTSKAPKKARVPSSWKSFKNSIKKGVKKVVTRLRINKNYPKEPSEKEDMLRPTNENNTETCNILPTCPEQRSQIDNMGTRMSLASFTSSDSTALTAWLAERCSAALEVADDIPGGMSIVEYELMGSWLDLDRGDIDWVCGHQGCELHLPDGSPNDVCEHTMVFRAAMPFNPPDLQKTTAQPIARPLILSAAPRVLPLRFSSLPRLPSESFDMTPPPPRVRTNAGQCLSSKASRELSMPGGWTF